jgi:sulfur-carrier protein adenylyltransferase/sulfurtransferase
MLLNLDERNQFSRQIILPDFGIDNQQKLKNAKVLVVGAGGLGSPVLLYLASAGIGAIGVLEYDKVARSNLQRQILYDTKAIGKSKMSILKDKLLLINPQINLLLFEERLEAKNALKIFEDFDVIIDTTDNFPTRYLINDACEILSKPFVAASVNQYEAQIGVFNHLRSCTYRDLFPTPPPAELAPNCAEAGVMGPLCGMVGSLQASEAIKLITGLGALLKDQILLIDVLDMEFRKIKIKKTAYPTITQLIDYEQFCGIIKPESFELAYDYFQDHLPNHVLIDIREPNEHEMDNIGGENIPLADLEDFLEQYHSQKPIVLYCQSGQRSKMAVLKLKEKFNKLHLYSLLGGINNSNNGTNSI